MSIALNRGDECCQMQLVGSIDISCAVELKQSLLQVLEAGQEICVSLTEATEVDVIAIQLLWAAERIARQRGFGFRVMEPPAPICQALAQTGLAFFVQPAGIREDHPRSR